MWKPNIWEIVMKASIALYCCRRAIGKRFKLSPKVIFWLQEIIVKSTMLYVDLVWLNSLEKTTLVIILIKKALKTTITLTLNVIA